MLADGIESAMQSDNSIGKYGDFDLPTLVLLHTYAMDFMWSNL